MIKRPKLENEELEVVKLRIEEEEKKRKEEEEKMRKELKEQSFEVCEFSSSSFSFFPFFFEKRERRRD